MTQPDQRVAIVAQRDEVDLHDDGPLLLEALAAEGLDAEPVSWGHPRDWSAYDGVLVRNTWDYVEDRDAFLAWAQAVESVTRLANPAAVLAWNSDKRYLQDLNDRGIPVVPTRWVAPGEDPGEAVRNLEWREYVVKPSVSAGSRRTARYRQGEEDRASAHVAELVLDGLTAMVQPYVDAVDVEGEAGVYVFGGEASHAITKGAVLVQGVAAVDDLTIGRAQVVTARPVTDDLASFAVRVLAALPEELPEVVYARVDSVRDADGARLLLELEVIEPFLFLATAEGSATRLAAAVARWLEA